MIVIFTGPTLHPDEARGTLEAVYLAPVSQGDLYRVSLHRPSAIGIIDGYFDQIPSVWHKEVLWAISQGIRVYGSSSMGALRASELEPFGMVGVGRIFEAFRSGELEDDDEVAIHHGPAEFGYRQLSEAMVNIRATLAAAQADGVITEQTYRLLLHTAKELFYTERTYQRTVELAYERGGDGEELRALLGWLRTGRIDQKRADALALLRLIRDTAPAQDPSPQPGYHFEYTTLWDELCRSAGQLQLQSESVPEAVPQQAVLDELRLARESWPRLATAAVALRLADAELRRQGVELADDDIDAAIVRFCEQHHLADVDELAAWIAANHLTGGGFMRLIAKEIRLRTMRERIGEASMLDLVDCARLEGLYPQLARRALAKRPIFTGIDAYPPAPELYEQALEWYLGRAPEPAERLTTTARALGFEGVDELRRAVLGEFLLHQLSTPQGEVQSS